MPPKKQVSSTSAPSGHARDWTPEQRRAAFSIGRKDTAANYQIIESDFQEALVPYNHITFDRVLGLKGMAHHGTVTQIHGDEGAGKSTTTISMVAEYQKQTSEPVGFFAYEPTTTPDYLRKLGVDMDFCFLMYPSSVQTAVWEHIRLMKMGVRLFVNDSIPFMDTKIEEKDIKSGKFAKANYGGNAKAMSLFYKTLRPYLQEYDAALLMVNQTRDRIDNSREAQYATKYDYVNRIYTLPGGRMCRFMPSVMLELTLEKAMAPMEMAKMETDDLFIVDLAAPGTKPDPTINKVRVRTLKNKVTGAGFRKGNIYIRPGKGIDESVNILELSRQFGYITNSGARWYVGKSKEDSFAQYANKAEALEALVVKRDPDVIAKLRSLVYESVDDKLDMFVAEVSSEEMDFLDESKQTISFNPEEDDELA
jgi:RecA/RadA recombinase